MRAKALFPGQMLAFFLGSAVNGGLVGAVGPSMHEIGLKTGLSSSDLGQAVMLNRVAKLVGSFLSMAYARLVEEGQTEVPPRLLLTVTSAICAACAFALATMQSNQAVLQAALCASGLAYGFSDSTMTLLTVWANRSPAQQRTQVALLNLGFTVGALLSPTVIAISLRVGGTVYAGFYAVAILAAVTGAAFLICVHLPLFARVSPSDSRSEEATDEGSEGAYPSWPAPPPPTASAASALCSAERLVLVSMTAVLFCVTGCEHAIATWLPSFGHHVGGIEHSEMAVMSAAYWSMICLGRIAWALISPSLSSGFPALAFDGALMLVSALLIADFGRSEVLSPPSGPQLRSSLQLWIGSIGLGFGCSSSLPCAITLPAEAKVELTPVRLLVLNLAGSAGETLLPYLIGLAFEQRRYTVLGTAVVLMELVVTGGTACAWWAARVQTARVASNPIPLEQTKLLHEDVEL